MLPNSDEIHFSILKQAEAVTIPLAIIFENSWKKEGFPGIWGKTHIVPTLLKKPTTDIYTHTHPPSIK